MNEEFLTVVLPFLGVFASVAGALLWCLFKCQNKNCVPRPTWIPPPPSPPPAKVGWEQYKVGFTVQEFTEAMNRFHKLRDMEDLAREEEKASVKNVIFKNVCVKCMAEMPEGTLRCPECGNVRKLNGEST